MKRWEKSLYRKDTASTFVWSLVSLVSLSPQIKTLTVLSSCGILLELSVKRHFSIPWLFLSLWNFSTSLFPEMIVKPYFNLTSVALERANHEAIMILNLTIFLFLLKMDHRDLFSGSEKSLRKFVIQIIVV